MSESDDELRERCRRHLDVGPSFRHARSEHLTLWREIRAAIAYEALQVWSAGPFAVEDDGRIVDALPSWAAWSDLRTLETVSQAATHLMLQTIRASGDDATFDKWKMCAIDTGAVGHQIDVLAVAPDGRTFDLEQMTRG